MTDEIYINCADNIKAGKYIHVEDHQKALAARDKTFNGVTFCIVNEKDRRCEIQTEDPATCPRVVAENVTVQFAKHALSVLNSHGETLRQLAARDKTIEELKGSRVFLEERLKVRGERIADLEAKLEKHREIIAETLKWLGHMNNCSSQHFGKQCDCDYPWMRDGLQAALDLDKGEKKEKKRKLARCPMCDATYYLDDLEEVAIHVHPEPQSGPPRRDFMDSKMPYSQWIVETEQGREWVRWKKERAPDAKRD